VKLLVSVATAEDARSALAGGADVIDAKDPAVGPLGPVKASVLRAIGEAVGDARPISAALGDLCKGIGAGPVAAAREFGDVGLAFAKVGFGDGLRSADAAAQGRDVLAAAACPVVFVAYADRGLDPFVVIELAAALGAAGVLLDTADKRGAGVMALRDPWAMREWIVAAQHRGLTAAIAGRLTLEDVPRVVALGADVAGVRGAACEGGRAGRVTALRVRALAAAAQVASHTGQHRVVTPPAGMAAQRSLINDWNVGDERTNM
jgi:(5-formylfuran-3-yl)methyl phosphate synthase